MHTVITHDLFNHQPGEKFCLIQLACAGCVSISLLSEKSWNPEFSFSPWADMFKDVLNDFPDPQPCKTC